MQSPEKFFISVFVRMPFLHDLAFPRCFPWLICFLGLLLAFTLDKKPTSSLPSFTSYRDVSYPQELFKSFLHNGYVILNSLKKGKKKKKDTLHKTIVTVQVSISTSINCTCILPPFWYQNDISILVALKC